MVRSNNRHIQGAVLALLLNILASQAFAAYDPAFCQSVAGTLNIHWQAVAGPFSPCTGIEFTDGSLADAEDGSIVMSGTSVSDPVCLVTGAYEFSLSADTTQLVGSDTSNNIPMTLTRGPGEECFVGTWSFRADVYEAHIWAGAFLHSINAGHSGAWFNPDTSGQGQFIDVVPEEQFMFISWFTYTDAASDNPFEQRWLTAQGNYSGNTAELDLFESLGGRFDDPQMVTTTQVGEVTLTFSDCDMGTMSYSFDEEELDGEFPMIRVIPGSGNVCEGLSGNNTEAVDINAGMDGAWFDPGTSGQGYFIDAYPDPEGGNLIFVSWFTYGNATASGQRWLTAQGGFEGSMAEIDVFETTGGSFDDPEPANTTKVGTMSLDFTDCSNAQLTYSLPADPAEGDITITRVIPGSQALCEELAGAD